MIGNNNLMCRLQRHGIWITHIYDFLSFLLITVFICVSKDILFSIVISCRQTSKFTQLNISLVGISCWLASIMLSLFLIKDILFITLYFFSFHRFFNISWWGWYRYLQILGFHFQGASFYSFCILLMLFLLQILSWILFLQVPLMGLQNTSAYHVFLFGLLSRWLFKLISTITS